MKIVYAETCNCTKRVTCGDEIFEPVFLDDEQEAARRYLEAELRLMRGDGGRYFAYHVNGRHITAVWLGGG